ncbi:MAG: DEAD/DEAH box helicase, partial [Treponema sp.]|nr:DEAD/DEAH box helicase [Treponema sp.]
MENFKIDEGDWIYEDDPVAKAAYDNFGIRYMFPWQRMVVSNIMEAYEAIRNGKDLSQADDVFCKGRQIVLLPTGAGKSLCFQVPALLLDGPTLVIYPLLALMTDQQRRMEEGSLRSVTFRGGQSQEERAENFRKLKEGAKIILANPEVLQSKSLVSQLKEVGICHLAIDEAHCVSEWGDSFRPSYLGLGEVIKEIDPPVITAFTATASPPVLARVAEILF